MMLIDIVDHYDIILIMKERDSNGRPTSPFMEKFLSGPGVIESERLKRVDRLAHSFKLGTYEGDDKGNKVAVKVGLVGRRIIKSLDIWEHLADVEDRHTVLELDNDYNGDGPIPHSFTATQEVYLDEELSSVETS